MKMSRIVQYVGLVALGYLSLTFNLVAHAADTVAASNKIESVDFATLPGGKLNIRVTLSQPMANPPAGFTMTNPARIALDFPDTANGLSKSTLSVNQGALRSLNIAQGKNRTRLVLNLTKPSGYTARVDGNAISIDLQTSGTASAETSSLTHFAEATSSEQPHQISNVDFVRGKNGEGRIIVDLSDNATGIDIRQQGQKIQVDFLDADLPESLQRRLNVTDFATPVLNVDTARFGKNVRMTIEPKGLWEHSAYQADRKFIVDVRPLVEDPNKLTQGSKQGYKGEKLSLNFQDIEVRSVLQVIADFTGFNIITSDNVSGKLTLRLKDVPWDQALDIIMQTRGLGMRKNGNVVWIAPNEELAAKEKSRLDAEQEIADREPLITQSFQINYQKAEDIRSLISGRGAGSTAAGGATSTQRLLSKRGSATVDARTNILFVQDIDKNLKDIERVINQIDKPVRQVLVESRIVLADDGFSKELGAKFGFAKAIGSGQHGIISAGPNIATTRNLITDSSKYGLETIPGTTTSTSSGASSTTPATTTPLFDTGLNVNLPATSGNAGTLGLSFLKLPAGLLLSLELSAAEQDNRTKTISSPRVITANRQKAIIESGVEIPYQEASSSGATSVSFKKATLGLEVTPQITPDNKISMDLMVKKDSVGGVFNGVPSINTNQVQTQVLVNNGETAVLGGILEDVASKKLDKVPFFGDIPVVGNLFKRTFNQTKKNELLIFISPKLIDESLKAD